MNVFVVEKDILFVGGLDVVIGEVLLRVDDVLLFFGGVKVIIDIFFDIFKGEIRVIIGLNGVGKILMFNVINGFYYF